MTAIALAAGSGVLLDGAMHSAASAAERRPTVRPLVAFYSIIGFWLFYVVIITARAAVGDFPAQGEMALRRMVVTAIGIAFTWALYLVIRRFDDRALWTRIAAAVLFALPCAIAVALFNYYVFSVFEPISLFDEAHQAARKKDVSLVSEIAEGAIQRYFFFIAWAALYLAMSYAGEVRFAERRAAQFARAAQAAELKSLRYQVNPHFLFNTLNSLSSLVLAGRGDDAEAMIQNLSTFYRTSLSGDPLDDATLDEEVTMQRLYLDIEAVRFPERLKTRIDIPDAMRPCCVPGMILQPLVENAIKYGVSRTSRPVTVTIAARSEGGRLVITVADDGNVVDPAAPSEGEGIGLANVRDRLAARFGDEARMEWLAPDDGGFIVRLTMPEVRRGC